MLTWPPAGDVPVTCWRGEGGGYCPSQGGGQNTPGHWDCLRVNCGHVIANMVRYIYKFNINILNGWMEGRTNGHTDGQTYGWIDGQIDGWKEGQMDGRMDK